LEEIRVFDRAISNLINGRSVLTPINLPPVSDAYNEDGEVATVNVSDQPVIADPIFPEAPQFRAFKGFADATLVFQLATRSDKNRTMRPAGSRPSF
jgi:hypothetical protein